MFEGLGDGYIIFILYGRGGLKFFDGWLKKVDGDKDQHIIVKQKGEAGSGVYKEVGKAIR